MSLNTYALDAASGTTTTAAAPTWTSELTPRLTVIVVGGALSTPGTSSAEPTQVWEAPYVHEPDATGSGPASVGRQRAASDRGPDVTRRAITELRRISGLTWEQLGRLFGVSRRSVHFWASGKPPNAANEERLMRVLDVVREADRGDARSTRAALLEVTGGTTPFELLADQRFDDARTLLGPGVGRHRPALTELSDEAKAARKPLPPEELFDAKHERVHQDTGRARAARTARNKGRGRS